MSKRIIISALIVIAVVGSAIYYFQSAVTLAKNGTHIRVSGNIEVTEAEVSFKIPGRVQKREVNEGERVTNGQEVAKLDSAELQQQVAVRDAEAQAAEAALRELEAGTRPEQIKQAQAGMEAAKAALDELLAGARPQELESAKSELAAAQADAKRTTGDLDRIKSLYDQKVVSTQMRDNARAASDVAESRLRVAQERLALVQEGPRKETIDRARAMLREAEEQYELAKKGPRQETIDQARARVKAAKEALEVAKIQLSNATLASPLTGMVLSENVEDGEFVSPGMPVVTVADIEHPWLRAYINETDLGKVKVGQKVDVTTDTFPGKIYEGTITFISPQAEFTPKSVQTDKERVKLVYRVRIEIANPNLELKPGMPADGVILVASSS